MGFVVGMSAKFWAGDKKGFIKIWKEKNTE